MNSSRPLVIVVRRGHSLDPCVESRLPCAPNTDVDHASRRYRIGVVDDDLIRNALRHLPADLERVFIDRSADDSILSWIISAAANSDVDVVVVDRAMITFDADRTAISCQTTERPFSISSIHPFLRDSSMPLILMSVPSHGNRTGHPRCSLLQFFWERFPQSFRTAIRMLRERKTSACNFLKRLTRRLSKIRC